MIIDSEYINPAVAAIEYALTAEEGMTFLRLWNEGEFDIIREEWHDVPDEVFIGADPLFTHQKLALMGESNGAGHDY
ncbi:hypothetical protein [Shewanella aestuarii]|uniref:Uncharacterized protein n=1 Tax=Shewanella aestuarii TaxID=1028752 RepID=A0A6G9QQ81_9GAMM|nr:hypothetical protein [Shewanella aestuarii]QIR16578.1 hypothetical protein HBH39_19070 [Shewanella aestuarii]